MPSDQFPPTEPVLLPRRVAFFHGLESAPNSEKSRWLAQRFEHVYAPAMDYRDPEAFDTVLAEVRRQQIEWLIGSSMGGWFAHCLASLTGLPTLLFNPALQGRSLEPVVRTGGLPARHTIVLGQADTVIIPEKTVEWLQARGIEDYRLFWEAYGHRTPQGAFERYVGRIRLSDDLPIDSSENQLIAPWAIDRQLGG
jgi:hypothetical protein